MRILVISNFYPPHYFGGYELGCKDVIDRLVKRGHEVTVLTSTYGVDSKKIEDNVYRMLRIQSMPECGYHRMLLKLLQIDWRNNTILRNLIRKLRPDIISVWNMGQLPKSMLVTIERQGIPAVYGISDHWLGSVSQDEWLLYWQQKPLSPLKRLLKRTLGFLIARNLPLDIRPWELGHAFFTSDTLRSQQIETGFAVQNAEIIYWGIDTTLFKNRSPERIRDNNTVKMLFAGQVERHKGIHTAVEAVCMLIGKGYKNVKLHIVGTGEYGAYINLLRSMATKWNASDYVTFAGKVPRDEMPGIYNEHQILLFPSIWEEPFAITILEAMACGLAVIGTTTGGSREILVDGENSLTFPAGDSQALARQIERLILDSDLRTNISMAGERLIREKFTLDIMVDQIEKYLQTAIACS